MTQALPTGALELPAADDPHRALWVLLEQVTDPEIPVVSLREMGVLRAIRQGDAGLEVVITPTYSGCPAMDQMHDDVVTALARAGLAARVVTRLAPAWSSDWITPAAREKLRAYGIAPPRCDALPTEPKDAIGNVIQFAARPIGRPADRIACPQCGSDNTTETSHFGSTACKALYRCLDCREPFDYFKPY